MKHKCPLCKGTGNVEKPAPKKNDRDRRLAKMLRKEGYTIRTIMSVLGYKHPGSISHLLK